MSNQIPNAVERLHSSVPLVLPGVQESRNLRYQNPPPYDTSENSIPVPCNSPVITPSNSAPRELGLTDEIDLAEVHSCDVSIVSECGSDDEPYPLSNLELDAVTSQHDYVVAEGSESSCSVFRSDHQPVGLGISGLTRKNEDIPFDGLGLVAFNSCSISMHDDTNGSSFSHESATAPSEKFLQEILFTFNEDPFHAQISTSTADCKSWYEPEDYSSHFRTPSQPRIERVPLSLPSRRRCRRHCSGDFSLPSETTSKHFSSATISSELKRTTQVRGHSPLLGLTPRARSASWPTTNTDGYRGKSITKIHWKV